MEHEILSNVLNHLDILTSTVQIPLEADHSMKDCEAIIAEIIFSIEQLLVRVNHFVSTISRALDDKYCIQLTFKKMSLRFKIL